MTEGKNWKPGKLWFMDKDGAYVLRLFNSVDSLLFINTDFVKPEEVKKATDLLNPKWQGKISSEDPTSDRGSGGNTAANIYSQLGGDFAKKLYVDQKVQISRDRRQLTDWLARGNYPICLTCRADDVKPLIKEGFKILEIYDIEGLQGPGELVALPAQRRQQAGASQCREGFRQLARRQGRAGNLFPRLRRGDVADGRGRVLPRSATRSEEGRDLSRRRRSEMALGRQAGIWRENPRDAEDHRNAAINGRCGRPARRGALP